MPIAVPAVRWAAKIVYESLQLGKTTLTSAEKKAKRVAVKIEPRRPKRPFRGILRIQPNNALPSHGAL